MGSGTKPAEGMEGAGAADGLKTGAEGGAAKMSEEERKRRKKQTKKTNKLMILSLLIKKIIKGL